MALIAMAVYDTPENRRADMTRDTLNSLARTVDFSRHRLVVVDNGSTCEHTIRRLGWLQPDARPHPGTGYMLPPARVIRNTENRGTARAVNQGWMLRNPGEHCVKMDNDVAFHQSGWLDVLEEAVVRPSICIDGTLRRLGIIGLKRDDLEECPDHDNPWFRSELRMLPHRPGERWVAVGAATCHPKGEIAVERVHHVMGTCQLYSSDLLDRIGYLYQGGRLYGFDDALSAVRAREAGFYSAFLCNYRITHLDPGGDAFCDWKARYAGDWIDTFHRLADAYLSGARPPYHGPEDE